MTLEEIEGKTYSCSVCKSRQESRDAIHPCQNCGDDICDDCSWGGYCEECYKFINDLPAAAQE